MLRLRHYTAHRRHVAQHLVLRRAALRPPTQPAAQPATTAEERHHLAGRTRDALARLRAAAGGRPEAVHRPARRALRKAVSVLGSRALRVALERSGGSRRRFVPAAAAAALPRLASGACERCCDV
jgi:hypothetical protein